MAEVMMKKCVKHTVNVYFPVENQSFRENDKQDQQQCVDVVLPQ